MPTISAISQSPIAKYLLGHRALPKKVDKNTVQFFSRENVLLGELKKSGYRGERQVTTTVYDENKNPLFKKFVVIKKIVKDLIINKKNCAVVPEGYTIYSEVKDFTKNTIATEVKTNKLVSELKKGDYKCDFPIYNTNGRIKYSAAPDEAFTIQTKSFQIK